MHGDALIRAAKALQRKQPHLFRQPDAKLHALIDET
jgi:hypothetical protein